MQKSMNSIDWNHLRAFLETAETGSLSAAARKLGLTQPTLSRQVAAAEASVGVTLFERVGKKMVLTATGLALLDHARGMGAAADSLWLAAAGRAEAVEGVVTVSATDGVAACLLPALLAHVQIREPGIRVELVSTDALSDLRRREADIAVRHVDPEQPDLIARRVRQATAGFYASQAWIERHGHPRSPDEATHHRFIGADRSGRYLGMLREFGLALTEDHFSCYAESNLVAIRLAAAGLGIVATMEEAARQAPGLVRVLEDVPPIEFPFWLVTHRELRTSRRIRVVFDLLADGLAAGAPA